MVQPKLKILPHCSYGTCDNLDSTFPKKGIVIGTVATGAVLFTIIFGVIYVYCCRQKFVFRGRYDLKRELVMKGVVLSDDSRILRFPQRKS